MTYRLDVTLTARDEIGEAYQWKRQHSSTRSADRWLAQIGRAIQTLDSLPERCGRAPEADAFGREIRQLLHGKRTNVYRILFEVVGDVVRILHVRHAARPFIEPDE